MKVSFKSFYLSALVFFSGCSDWKNYVNDRYPPIPEELYYGTTGSCAEGNLSFQVLTGRGALLWDIPNTQSVNDILTGQVSIYLNRDSTFTVNYREFDFMNEVLNKTVSSTFSFDPESQQIFLNNLGVATIQSRRGRYYLKLTFTTNLNSDYLAGQTIDVWLYSSYRGLDTDRQDYCGL